MNKPEPGYYFHYKHDPEVAWNDHAYLVMGVTRHTEDQSNAVLYRPVYENKFLAPADYCIRPLQMFMDHDVEWEGETHPERFRKISDPELIQKLDEEMKKLYK